MKHIRNYFVTVIALGMIACGAGLSEEIKVWRLRPISLKVSTEDIFRVEVTGDEIAVIRAFLVTGDPKIVKIGSAMREVEKLKNQKLSGSVFVGESMEYVVTDETGRCYLVEVEQGSRGLCRIAAVDRSQWPLITASEWRITITHPAFAAAVTKSQRETKEDNESGNTKVNEDRAAGCK